MERREASLKEVLEYFKEGEYRPLENRELLDIKKEDPEALVEIKILVAKELDKK